MNAANLSSATMPGVNQPRSGTVDPASRIGTATGTASGIVGIDIIVVADMGLAPCEMIAAGKASVDPVAGGEDALIWLRMSWTRRSSSSGTVSGTAASFGR